MGHFDIMIIGGGAAGIAAARAAADAGCKSIALVERKQKLGGILLQCSHPGFGAGLTGGEYAAALVQDFPETVTLFLGTTVLSVEPNKTAHLSGDRQISFSQLILATGSREIPLGALPIAGTRPKGVYTAGQMQEMMTSMALFPKVRWSFWAVVTLALSWHPRLRQWGFLLLWWSRRKTAAAWRETGAA